MITYLVTGRHLCIYRFLNNRWQEENDERENKCRVHKKVHSARAQENQCTGYPIFIQTNDFLPSPYTGDIQVYLKGKLA